MLQVLIHLEPHESKIGIPDDNMDKGRNDQPDDGMTNYSFENQHGPRDAENNDNIQTEVPS